MIKKAMIIVSKLISKINRNIPYYKGKTFASKILISIFKNIYYDEVVELYKDKYILLDTNNYIDKNIYYSGYWERKNTTFIMKLIKENPVKTFFDIGANIGYYSILVSKYVDKTYCFEPSKVNYERLKLNIQLNPNCYIKSYRVGLGNANENVKLYHSGKDSGSYSTAKPKNYNNTFEYIKIIRFDDFFKNNDIDEIDLIKIDAEGSEMKVLYGMENTLKNNYIKLLIEINDGALQKQNSSAKEVFNYLHNINYHSYKIDKNGRIKNLDYSEKESLVYFSK